MVHGLYYGQRNKHSFGAVKLFVHRGFFIPAFMSLLLGTFLNKLYLFVREKA